MTALDIIVLLLVLGGLVLGWFKGFVGEVLSLAAWIVAIVFLRLLFAPVTSALTGVVGTHAGAAVLAFVLVFGLVFLVGKFVARRVGRGVRRSVIGPFDRLLGAGFGALKGLDHRDLALSRRQPRLRHDLRPRRLPARLDGQFAHLSPALCERPRRAALRRLAPRRSDDRRRSSAAPAQRADHERSVDPARYSVALLSSRAYSHPHGDHPLQP